MCGPNQANKRASAHRHCSDEEKLQPRGSTSAKICVGVWTHAQVLMCCKLLGLSRPLACSNRFLLLRFIDSQKAYLWASDWDYERVRLVKGKKTELDRNIGLGANALGDFAWDYISRTCSRNRVKRTARQLIAMMRKIRRRRRQTEVREGNEKERDMCKIDAFRPERTQMWPIRSCESLLRH